jgi:hypothetical protein
MTVVAGGLEMVEGQGSDGKGRYGVDGRESTQIKWIRDCGVVQVM